MAKLAKPAEEQKVCARCGEPRADDVDSNICGNCADDLRADGESTGADSYKRMDRQSGR